MRKLIIIEGIPGSGKTTYAERITEYLIQENMDVECYMEGDLHPADLAWCAVLNAAELKYIIKKYPIHKANIEKYMHKESDRIIIPYLDLNLSYTNPLREYLQKREPFNGKLSADEFLEINMIRWESFAKKAINDNKIYIFESVFLQNHINEMMLLHEKNINELVEYFTKLYSTFASLNPLVVYLNHADVKETIYRVATQRVSQNENEPNWIDRVNEYFQNSSYGATHNLQGTEGSIKFFTTRKALELEILASLNIDSVVVMSDDYNWDKIFDEILSIFI